MRGGSWRCGATLLQVHCAERLAGSRGERQPAKRSGAPAQAAGSRLPRWIATSLTLLSSGAAGWQAGFALLLPPSASGATLGRSSGGAAEEAPNPERRLRVNGLGPCLSPLPSLRSLSATGRLLRWAPAILEGFRRLAAVLPLLITSCGSRLQMLLPRISYSSLGLTHPRAPVGWGRNGTSLLAPRGNMQCSAVGIGSTQRRRGNDSGFNQSAAKKQTKKNRIQSRA